jgi:hypothetical protein
MLRDKAAHRRDDANPVRAGNGQGVAVRGGHIVIPRIGQ